jgi:HD superfamily phosphohydrolase
MSISIPELAGHSTGQLIRIPPEVDVPVSSRVLALLDTPAMQRLKGVSQLGLVAQVYPGATHSRFEHSLGVYRLACIVLQHLLRVDERLAAELSETEAEIFLLAALLHDVGHWPYCHPIEDMGLEGIPRHEELARVCLTNGEIAEVVAKDWQVEIDSVANFLSHPADSHSLQVLQGVMNGPLDIDKMDYLNRDSLHAGVPYGRNFDINRLISSLKPDHEHRRLGITQKGKTAAEMMVFARYVMFSEVYWHHAVRAATAMLQRQVFNLVDAEASPAAAKLTHTWLQQSDLSFQASLQEQATSSLASMLFGNRRQIYKRVGQFSFSETPTLHDTLARKPYPELVAASRNLGKRIARQFALDIKADDILIDAPPVKLEVQFNLNVFDQAGGSSPLANLSPVVKSLAIEQFDNYVKQVRVFARPGCIPKGLINDQVLKDLLADC